MGRECGTYRAEEKCVQNFVSNPKLGDLFGKLRVDGRIILKWILMS